MKMLLTGQSADHIKLRETRGTKVGLSSVVKKAESMYLRPGERDDSGILSSAAPGKLLPVLRGP